MPKISVCITTFNHEKYIEQCVKSVMEQCCGLEIEILVGDDCSSDGTRALLKQLAASSNGMVSLYFHSQQLGASRNLQVLIAESKGEFIAQLDGDDYWLPGKLAKQMAIFEADQKASAVYCNAYIINSFGDSIGEFNNAGDCRIDLDRLLWSGNFLNTSSLMYRAIYKNLLLGLNSEFIDYRMHVNLASVGHLIHIGEKLVTYRWLVSGGMTHKSREKICILALDAIRDARSFGGGENALKNCLKKQFRTVFYDSMATLDIARIYRFHRVVSNDAVLRKLSSILQLYLSCCVCVPRYIFKHLLRKIKPQCVFFSVKNANER